MVRILSAGAMALLVAGCSSSIPANAVFACSGALCPAGLQCRAGYCFPLGGDGGCFPHQCESSDLNCGELDDGCGSTVQCGSCTSPESCGGGGHPNVCGCAAPSDSQLCDDAGFKCGPLTRADSCGKLRSVACGVCGAGQVCAAAATGASCLPCSPETDAVFCARHLASCGELSSQDNCEHPRVASCGACAGCAADGGSCCLARGQPCVAAGDCCDGRGCFNGRCEATDGGF